LATCYGILLVQREGDVIPNQVSPLNFPSPSLPQGCTPGGHYQASTGSTTTVSGAFNMKVNVTLAQTSCTAAQGAAGTWSMVATWPKINVDAVMAIYPVTGGNIGLEFVMNVNDMTATASGTYGYTVNAATQQLCVTDMNATQSSITVSSVTATAGLNGAPGTSLPTVADRVETQITDKGLQIANKLNSKFSKKVGTCKTVGTPLPPRAPLPPRSPRVVGRRLSGADQ